MPKIWDARAPLCWDRECLTVLKHAPPAHITVLILISLGQMVWT